MNGCCAKDKEVSVHKCIEKSISNKGEIPNENKEKLYSFDTQVNSCIIWSEITLVQNLKTLQTIMSAKSDDPPVSELLAEQKKKHEKEKEDKVRTQEQEFCRIWQPLVQAPGQDWEEFATKLVATAVSENIVGSDYQEDLFEQLMSCDIKTVSKQLQWSRNKSSRRYPRSEVESPADLIRRELSVRGMHDKDTPVYWRVKKQELLHSVKKILAASWLRYCHQADKDKYVEWMKGFLRNGGQIDYWRDHDLSDVSFHSVHPIRSPVVLTPFHGATAERFGRLIVPENVEAVGGTGHIHVYYMEDFTCNQSAEMFTDIEERIM